MYELLVFALQPRKSGLGGVDGYLIGKLCSDRPRTIKDAMLRLCKGMNNSIQVRRVTDHRRAHAALAV